MLTTEQGTKELSGIHVYDGVVITQIIEKLLKSGAVSGKELLYVASLRSKVVAAIQVAVGVDIDNIEQEKDGGSK